ncbi:hypothetical protein GCM10007874_56990 [Labrys miyagiensis]|uniref:Glycosyltransferase n=1 Tax=Labrys miyagiensis TaxID=346912 RepID=A0ABQ6CVD8_9HYPH|nr:hypothetical protein [Labrys miyagiensis]GLS22679.1 hypothetical protein GCM10007874_56990 [Labrys miyagiensis]
MSAEQPISAHAGLPASICIATPAYEGSCKMGYVDSLLKLVVTLRELGISISFATAEKSSIIALARNILADYFLRKTTATHLLFIDADMRFRVEDVLRMLGHSSCDVIGAICPGKTFDWPRIARIAREQPGLPPERLAERGAVYVSTPELLAAEAASDGVDVFDEPIEVSGVGTGLMLIRREVFEALRNAHPEWLLTSGIVAGGHAFFSGGRMPDGGFAGEDFAFCQDARAIGVRIFACPWFKIGHIGTYEFVGELATAR